MSSPTSWPREQAVTTGLLDWARYWERLPWQMHNRYDDGEHGPCHMYDALTTSASRSQISMS